MTMPTTPQDSFSQQSVDRRDRSFGGRSERLQVLSSNVPPNSGIALRSCWSNIYRQTTTLGLPI
jgi:hypothetical protein